MSTPLPSRTAANDKLIQSTPYDQLTQRQKDYADLYGLVLSPPVPWGAPMPASGIPPNAPGGSSYVGTPTSATVPHAPPGYQAPVNGVGQYIDPATGQLVTIPTAQQQQQQQSPAPDNSDALARMNALELLTREFINFGLFDGPNDPRLAGFRAQISQWLIQGYDPATISLMLQDTDVYKQRFSGNDARKARGLAVLSPSEYLAAERSYKQIFSSYGLPNGFYDSPAKLADLIGRDVSPTEVNDRVKSAVDFVNNADPLKRQELAMYFPELGTGDLVANFLDPKEAKPLLDKKIAATAIGYQAARQGLASPSAGDALKYADLGVNEDQARQAYGNIAEMLPTEQAIGQRFHQPYGQTDAEQELLGGLASARRKRDSLNNSEEALFAGSSGLSSDSLKRSQPGSY